MKEERLVSKIDGKTNSLRLCRLSGIWIVEKNHSVWKSLT